MKLIDLTHPIKSNMPVYPGDPETKIQQEGSIKKDGYVDHYLSIGTHAGTHIDAPSHMLENKKSLNQFPLEKFIGRGVCIKIDEKKFDLKEITKVTIIKNDIVFFHTGMSDIYGSPEYFQKYPAIPNNVANYLIEKAIKIVGIDSCSVDHKEFNAHKLFLQNEILIIENLTNLSMLSGKDFNIIAFPLNVSLDGSPIRVVAQLA